MARAVMLGNNGLTVGLDEKGLVHDFYYPYVGLENLTTSRMQPHHIGVWVDGAFSWLDSDTWKRHVDFEESALISDIRLRSESLQLEIHLKDFVDSHQDIFARKLIFKDLSGNDREVRVFFHQVFQISAQGRADTAMYVPDGNYMLDYKGRCSILAYAETEDGEPFDQYAAGNAGIEDKEGTFRDAEDGELSMSAVEHGGVDSTIRVTLKLHADTSRAVHYWLAVADTQGRLEDMHEQMLGFGFNNRLHATYQHWHDWLALSEVKLQNYDIRHARAVKKSLMVIKAHTDKHGGIIASCDSSIYNYGRDYYSYVWPRDGAYVIWPLIKLGYSQEPKAFFNFCQSIMHPDGYLMHKYQPDKAIGSTWHPLVHGRRRELAIQEDETAIVIYMLSEYAEHAADVEFVRGLYESFVRPACNFLSRFIDEQTGLPHASYDLWEEKFITSTYTTAVTYAALNKAVVFAKTFDQIEDADRWSHAASMLRTHKDKFFSHERGALCKGFLLTGGGTNVDNIVDVSSFYGAWRFGYSSEEQIGATLSFIEKNLLDASPSGGSPRYEDDGYFRCKPAYRGNPWFVTTLWLAQYYAETGQKDKAQHYIDWSLSKGLTSGVLSEQINPDNSNIVGVTPLAWSHAELINGILALN
ncbi:glycoside hydrolase family 15 protein [Candidatus Saccharibacteria bacterium]|nr:glycoside hydrolase family 15 protein [Candidatus Saccharibacteria bacterium]